MEQPTTLEIDDPEIAKWKFKKMLEGIEKTSGEHTSLITLIIRPGTAIADINKLLTTEYGTASSIKSRVNRQSVLDAITSLQQRMKLYKTIPNNGLALFCGVDSFGKKIMIAEIPPKPVSTMLYRCDNKFHVDPLAGLLDDDSCYGFIIISGDSSLFGTLSGSHKNVIHSLEADLPKKHNKGGQSSNRFARIRVEKRHNYLRKISELATQFFITDNKPNVHGIIVGGFADFKTELTESDMFDARLKKVILKIVDVAYAGMNGFDQAIDLSKDLLVNVKLVEEQRQLQAFFDNIAQDTGKYIFGIDQVLSQFTVGTIETLFVWDILAVTRIIDGKDMLLLDYIIENYNKYGIKLVLVSNKTPEGSQFCRGFGGLGGILRYQINLDTLEEETGIADVDF